MFDIFMSTYLQKRHLQSLDDIKYFNEAYWLCSGRNNIDDCQKFRIGLNLIADWYESSLSTQVMHNRLALLELSNLDCHDDVV